MAPYIHEILILGDLVLAINTSADPLTTSSTRKQEFEKEAFIYFATIILLRQNYISLESRLTVLFIELIFNGRFVKGRRRRFAVSEDLIRFDTCFSFRRHDVWNVYNMAGVDFSSN